MCYAATGVTARHTAACVTASCIATASAVGITATVTAISITTAIAVAAAIAITTPAAAPTPTVPRTCADEDAAREPAGSIVAIRRASVRVIRVVAPIACRGAVIAVITRGNNGRTHSDANCNLGMSCCRERHSQKHCQ